MVTPEIGLIIWQTIVFLIVFGILAAFVWKPIVSALKTRESFIEDSLQAAENAKAEMEQVKADNEYLLQEARIERDKMLKEAVGVANQIKEDAKKETSVITDKMIADAKVSIESEKKAALAEVKSLVASLSLEIAEKVLREKLASDKAQTELIDKFLKEVKVN
ncbi:F0F1 ATP synthase subunit B [Marinoscillum sp. MHG1-6]|uniref:F0F1 ATP synthase subunit B n=1 Tax=Marinoscillum sp. MHG1-6 TaxID=2959627 RepID=UPI0021573E70|nr:F0F1 ATP synthase subunit B [Marinoscillum sp. MHG1-6]